MLNGGMRSTLYPATLISALSLSVSLTSYGQDLLATPAIDSTIFREGAIISREFRFGSWRANCQEIIKIKRRVCNMLSDIIDESNQSSGSALIATTDTGVPAIVFALPSLITGGKDIAVEANQLTKIDGKVVKVQYFSIVKATLYDNGCKYMFPLDARFTFILNSGEQIKISISNNAHVSKTEKNKGDILVAKYFVKGDGFSEVLRGTTAPW
jgi:invasion protein IalB